MRKQRRLACLAKIESTYGTDSVPAAAANAIRLNDVTLTPLAGGEEARELMLPYLGNQGVELTGNYIQLEFSVEIAGAGAAGTAPGYGVLLRSCGLAETITANTSVEYDPVSDGEEASSIYFNQDGVRHVSLGTRGTVTMDFTPQRIPRFRFTMMGLLGTISDQSLPAPVLTGFKKPIVVSKANTTFSLHGYTAAAESIAIDLGLSVEQRLLIGAESIEITDRQSTGTAVIPATPLATKNWFSIAQNATEGTLQVIHGTAAGNIVQIDAPAVQIGRPTQGQTQGITNYTLPLMLKPSSGDDEITITIK